MELEKDRDELHDIARNDKNHIHELTVQNKAYELSDKHLKDQVRTRFFCSFLCGSQ